MCQCSLTCHDLSLWHLEPWRFVTTSWQYPSRRHYSYVCYRITVALFFFVWTIIDMATYGPGPKSRWMIHITNWSKLLMLIEVVLQASLTAHFQLWKLRRRPPGTPAVHQVSFNPLLRFFYAAEWLFTSVSGVFAIVTVFVSFLANNGGAFGTARYFTGLLYVIADHLLHNQPKHMLHVFYALFLHVLYIVFEAVYVLAGGTTPSGSSVIDGLDWSRPETAGYVSLSVVLVLAAHGGLWLLARLRELLYSCVSADHAIKLPLTGGADSQQALAPPYGATRHDPEGGNISPAPESYNGGGSSEPVKVTGEPSESGGHSPASHQPSRSADHGGHPSSDSRAPETGWREGVPVSPEGSQQPH
ncbi:uncharacterized protein LOC122364514 [Amphibalanus amphitrite]|uniref:uncharacterized protein LOC122364514 n=1 Tax=Amphibalanus amphitrite TaxID=1232801 RepID=UPI001C905E78|nr:uncharacterized protein LOC122364514 [Amphibalanus amphitrite]